MLSYKFLFENKGYIHALLETGVLSFFLTYFSIPKILKISFQNKILNLPNERSSHSEEVPHLGGIAIFFSIIICCHIFAPELSEYRYLYPSVIILCFTGIIDDFITIDAKNKLYTQIIAALLITIGSDIRIRSFFGVIGIYELNYFMSITFTVFVYIAIINAYNLIDGIDGLAGGIGIIASIAFLYTFLKLQEFSLVILSFSLATSLIAFLRYNFSKKKRIFMGDTGSMLVGFLLSFMAVKFIDICNQDNINFINSPAIAIAILIVPISDTLNVFILRILNGTSIFNADRRHIHHKLLRLNLTHIESTIIICLCYIFVLCVTYYFRYLEIHYLILLILCMGFLFSISPTIITRFLQKKEKI